MQTSDQNQRLHADSDVLRHMFQSVELHDRRAFKLGAYGLYLLLIGAYSLTRGSPHL